jgi:hypothetical protein
VVVITVVVIVVLVAVAAVVLYLQRRGAGQHTAPSTPPRPEPAPMTGLEQALNQVVDKSGTTMAARLDAESAHVDELRVSDDTGPLLRRALDHVRPDDDPDGESAPADD